MLSNCCQLSGWLHFTWKKNQLPESFQFVVVVCKHPVNTFSSELFLCEKKTFCPLMLEWLLLCLTPVLFVPLKVNSQSVFLPALFLSIHEGLTEHTSSLSASPCFTFTQSHTLLSWELPSTAKLLSSSTGADGIKGKGCSVADALFYIFTFSTQTLKLCLVMHRFRATNGAWSVLAEYWSGVCISSFFSCFTIGASVISDYAASWIVTSSHIRADV